MGLIEDLGAGNVGVDTAIFIYFIEEHPQFLPVILPLFQEADQDKRELITSALTLLEVLVVPYRAGNRILAERYEALLARSRGVRADLILRRHLHANLLRCDVVGGIGFAFNFDGTRDIHGMM